MFITQSRRNGWTDFDVLDRLLSRYRASEANNS